MQTRPHPLVRTPATAPGRCRPTLDRRSAPAPRAGAPAGPAPVAEPEPVPPPTPARGPSDRPRVRLSAREVEVLITWMRLETKEAVGQQLHISVGTVNTHLTRVRAKYAQAGRPATTKAALVIRALQDGYLDLDSF